MGCVEWPMVKITRDSSDFTSLSFDPIVPVSGAMPLASSGGFAKGMRLYRPHTATGPASAPASNDEDNGTMGVPSVFLAPSMCVRPAA